jgi:hypothetical protein
MWSGISVLAPSSPTRYLSFLFNAQSIKIAPVRLPGFRSGAMQSKCRLYWMIYISDVLDMVKVLDVTNGMRYGKA